MSTFVSLFELLGTFLPHYVTLNTHVNPRFQTLLGGTPKFNLSTPKIIIIITRGFLVNKGDSQCFLGQWRRDTPALLMASDQVVKSVSLPPRMVKHKPCLCMESVSGGGIIQQMCVFPSLSLSRSCRTGRAQTDAANLTQDGLTDRQHLEYRVYIL